MLSICTMAEWSKRWLRNFRKLSMKITVYRRWRRKLKFNSFVNI
jgi:hypothetical protein